MDGIGVDMASVALPVAGLLAVGLVGLLVGCLVNRWERRFMNGEPLRRPQAGFMCAVVYMAIVVFYGFSLEALELCAFAAVLLFLSLTDLDGFLIPNECVLAAIAVRVAYWGALLVMQRIGLPDIGYYVASAIGMELALLAAVLVADKVFGRGSMGGGDLKLFFAAGLYFGWQQGMLLVFLSCAIGVAVALFAPVSAPKPAPASQAASPSCTASPEPVAPSMQESVLHRAIPFGPSIAASCVITMLAGAPLVTWYSNLL